MNSQKTELLAPAGDLQTAMGAINAGADAVYLGAPLYSARAFAHNLTLEEIIYVIHYAHLHKAKVYLAMNTLMKNLELIKALEIIEPLYVEGLDGIIIQDYGLMMAVKEAYPSLELHSSTQMAVLSKRGCEWLREKGVIRVVPGRELSLEEIKELTESGVEIECFIHGAMCYSYSGRCLMSSLAGGRSGNRGRCAGPCRKCYTVTAAGEYSRRQGYYLSMKDMCSLPAVNELKAAGVSSLKIEGRMKDPAYAAGVCEIYRKYLDATENNLQKDLKEDMQKLASLYIRSSLQEGYYHKHNGSDMITIDTPSYQSIQEDRKEIIYEKYIRFIKKQKISMVVSVFENCPISLTINYGDYIIDAKGETAQRALKKALSEDDIIKQMDKLGDSFFEAEYIQVYTDGNSFATVKALNQIRRDGIAKLEALLFSKRTDSNLKTTIQRINTDNKKFCVRDPDLQKQECRQTKSGYEEDSNTRGLSKHEFEQLKVQVENCSQFLAAYEMGIRRFIIASDNLETGDSFWNMICGHIDCEYYYKLPDIVRQNTSNKIKRQLQEVLNRKDIAICGIYCPSLDALALAEDFVSRERIIADHGLYVFNKQSEEFILGHAAIYTASYELNCKELQHFAHKDAREIILYGRQDVMHSANCMYKTLGNCNTNAGCTILLDEQGREFPVFPRHKYCYNTIYNCAPLSLHSYVSGGENKLQASDYRMIFTTESPKRIREVLSFYYKVLSENKNGNPDFAYTTGHIKRGVD